MARLREDGAVLLGKTTTPEFGWKGVTDSPLTGITRNPWNLAKTPGGTSGGSAAAAAAGMAPLHSAPMAAARSASRPASPAFSASSHLRPRAGLAAGPFGTVAHVGPMTRTVEDAALMLNVIARPDARDWHALPYDGRDYAKDLDNGVKGLRIAFSPTLGYAEVDPEVATLVAGRRSFGALGAHVEQVDPGFPARGASSHVVVVRRRPRSSTICRRRSAQLDRNPRHRRARLGTTVPEYMAA